MPLRPGSAELPLGPNLPALGIVLQSPKGRPPFPLRTRSKIPPSTHSRGPSSLLICRFASNALAPASPILFFAFSAFFCGQKSPQPQFQCLGSPFSSFPFAEPFPASRMTPYCQFFKPPPPHWPFQHLAPQCFSPPRLCAFALKKPPCPSARASATEEALATADARRVSPRGYPLLPVTLNLPPPFYPPAIAAVSKMGFPLPVPVATNCLFPPTVKRLYFYNTL